VRPEISEIASCQAIKGAQCAALKNSPKRRRPARGIDQRHLELARRRAPARSSAQGRRLRLHVLIAADNAGRADATALKGQTAGAPFAAAIKKCAITVCVRDSKAGI